MARTVASGSWLGGGSLLLACASTVLLRADGPRLAGITLLADRLELLSQVKPDSPPDELARTAAEPHVLGRLPAPDPGVGVESSPDSLLVSESLSRSVVSYALCADAAGGACGQARLHYTSAGLAVEEGEPSAVLSSLPGLELRSGWVLASDAASKSLLAFRRVAPHRYEDEAGRMHEVGYRSPPVRDGKPDTSSRNFGRGNGLLVSVVLKGEEMARQINSPAKPLIERLVEIESGKVLLVFSTGTLRAIHLLELEEVDASVPYDLDDAENSAKVAPVRLVRGRITLFPAAPGERLSQPFLHYGEIAERVTGNVNIVIDGAQPLRGTSSVFLFDQHSTTAMTVEPTRDGPGGEIAGSLVSQAFRLDRLLAALQAAAGGGLVSPPFHFASGYLFEETTELCFTLEPVPLLFGFDPLRSPAERVRTVLGSEALLVRRYADGTMGRVGIAPSLVFTQAYAQAHGWIFDAANGELLAVTRSGNVNVVAGRKELSQAIGGAAPGQMYFIGIATDDLITFEPSSSSLLAIRLEPLFADFLRGDCNGDGRVGGNVADAVYLLQHSFLDGPPPPCAAACDANADGKAFGAVTDAVYMLTFGFLGGPPLPPPFPECGPGAPSDRELGCETASPRCR